MTPKEPRVWWIDDRFTLTARTMAPHHIAYLKAASGRVQVIELSTYTSLMKIAERMAEAHRYYAQFKGNTHAIEALKEWREWEEWRK